MPAKTNNDKKNPHANLRNQRRIRALDRLKNQKETTYSKSPNGGRMEIKILESRIV